MNKVFKIAIVTLSLIAAAVMIVAAYGGHVDPRHNAWPSLLTLGFPVVMAAMVIWMIVCLALRNWVAVAVNVAAVVASFPTIHSYVPLNVGEETYDKCYSFTVMSYNVSFFEPMTDNTPGATMKYILDVDPDFVVMQEASPYENDMLGISHIKALRATVEQRYPYHSKGGTDVAILSKYPYKVIEDKTMRNRVGLDGPGSFHSYGKIFEVEVNGQTIRLIGLHMQSVGLNAEDKQLYRDITNLKENVNTKAELKQVKLSLTDKVMASCVLRADEAQRVRDILDNTTVPVIVCGDFNDVPESFSYRTVMGHDMKDAYVECGTWPVNTFNSDRFYFKIDHMMYRGVRAVSSRVDKAGASDHYPLITTFEL
ncbi:MAG: endonuclease/exonuclease/phosphatase family protein [Muribaculaceae bacterium]|nr:endonuclease/exonuclease/phosphatase family protein [Muribaculaceae bacterium]